MFWHSYIQRRGDTPVESRAMQTMLLLYEISLKKNLVLLSGRMKLAAMFSPVETYLNPQRSSRRPPSWIFIRNIPFILPLGAENIPFTLPLGAEWME